VTDPHPSERVLPLVVRIEKADPPTRTAALEAAALAVLGLFADERAGGEWAEAIAAWEGNRIRKVVRRARGAHWDQAQLLDGLTIEHEGAQVRVYPPIPLDGWPPDLVRLQVSGTDLEDPKELPMLAPGVAMIWLAPDQPMSAGKAMAQVGHAAQLGWWRTCEEVRASWAAEGFPLAVRTATAGTWRRLLSSDLPLVRDAGFTEVRPGAQTAVADFPWLR
jgi:peptidyl-tRNA hydrolase